MFRSFSIRLFDYFKRKKRFPIQFAHDSADCGPACLKMICEFYGRGYSLDYLSGLCYLSKDGVSLLNLSAAAKSLGFNPRAVKVSANKLLTGCPLPCIIHWDQEHYVVLYKIDPASKILPGKRNYLNFTIADPAIGVVVMEEETFFKSWISSANCMGTVLLLEPTKEFYNKATTKEVKQSFRFSLKYLAPYKSYIVQVIFGLLLTSIVSFVVPFLTQFLVDKGVGNKSQPVINLILFSELFLLFGDVMLTNVRGWLLLHINARISFNIISDFLNKLFDLPIKFFDSKKIGDFSQRIDDHHRIESFLTGNIFYSIFSIINLTVFTTILALYNVKILLIYMFFNCAGIAWIMAFQKKRKHLDYKRFFNNKDNVDKIYEIVRGMHEIKLAGAENAKLQEWKVIQLKNFELSKQNLFLEQCQNSGINIFNIIKNVSISCLAAHFVIQNQLTVGALLSIAYIVGQTNSSIEQLTGLLKSGQDARLSMDRLQEIHAKENEEIEGSLKINSLPHGDIHIRNLSFQYEGPNSQFVLKNVSLLIPKGKITAIVGTSGSGKTTLMKLLIKFYQPIEGAIFVGNQELNFISTPWWRKQCGTVMQDGYIFNDTISNNVSIGETEAGDNATIEKMARALSIANLTEVVKSWPLGLGTKIGESGNGISGGQRQRILIARSVFKDPDYLFFDEATSSLDSNNEKLIMENLHDFFKGKTVVIIAHRLSTVKNADQIVVLENGEIAECGNHKTLTDTKGKYFNLVKNQLELSK